MYQAAQKGLDVNLSYAALLIYGLVAFVVIAGIKRMGDIRGLPAWVKLSPVVFAIPPIFVANLLLNPGAPAAEARLARLHEKVTLEIPAGHDLIVRGVLGDPDAITDNKKKAEAGKMNYRISVNGQGWEKQATGEIRRKLDRDQQGPTQGGAALKDTRSRAASLGEDLEQRFDLEGSGEAELEVAVWQGAAAEAVIVEVVKGPPERIVFWVITGLAILVGLIAEVHYKAVQMAGDLAFLAALAVFLPDQLTPLSGFQEAGVAAFAAALFGWLFVAGLAYLAMKVQELRASKAEDEAPGKG